MKKEKTAERVSNNYSNNIYFPISKYNIKTKIDYLTISLRNTNKDVISNILTAFEFRSISNKKLDKGPYRFKQSFKNSDNIVIELFYHPKAQYFPVMQMKIHDPNRELLDLLHSSFKDYSIPVNVSYVEMTFDFYTEEVIKLREYLKTHLFMTQQRSKSGRKRTTFYTNNLRKSVRGMRVYSRPGWNHARMELVMKSQLLKRLNLTFPLHSIDSLDLSRFFQFMVFDKERIHKYLCWCNRKQIMEAEKRRLGFGNLIRQQIRSWLNCFMINDHGDYEYIMKINEKLRSGRLSLPNHSRFLHTLDEFNTEFCRQVSSQKCLKSRNKGQFGGRSGLYSYRLSPKKRV
jgi:hypothetical protein